MQAGLKADHADMTADVLTWSDERGYHSHGAVRVEYYSERIAKGGITVDPKFEWRETGPCSAVFEGDNGCGYVASVLAMEKAIPASQWLASATFPIAAPLVIIRKWPPRRIWWRLHAASPIRWRCRTAG